MNTPALAFGPELAPRPSHWLWPGRIPVGKLTLLVGDPGIGKSLLAADLAARISSDNTWPDAPPHEPDSLVHIPGQGDVILHSAEDSPADTIIPRLVAAGATAHHVYFLQGITRRMPRLTIPDPDMPRPPILPLELPQHAELLLQAVRSVRAPRLLVLDHLHAVTPAWQKQPETVAALTHIAATREIAIVAICHLARHPGQRLLHRIRGSLAFAAAARSILLLTHDPRNPSLRVLACIKSILAEPPPPLAFRITMDGAITPAPAPLPDGIKPGSKFARYHEYLTTYAAPRIAWETAPADLAPDLFDLPPAACSPLTEACDWLSAELAPGPRVARDLIAAASRLGLSPRTLYRAKTALGVESVKLENGWMWQNVKRGNFASSS